MSKTKKQPKFVSYQSIPATVSAIQYDGTFTTWGLIKDAHPELAFLAPNDDGIATLNGEGVGNGDWIVMTGESASVLVHTDFTAKYRPARKPRGAAATTEAKPAKAAKRARAAAAPTGDQPF